MYVVLLHRSYIADVDGDVTESDESNKQQTDSVCFRSGVYHHLGEAGSAPNPAGKSKYNQPVLPGHQET